MATYKLLDHISITLSDENGILLDTKRNLFYSLNESAALFMKHLLQNGDAQAAKVKVCDHYECSYEIIDKDMDELIDSLLEKVFLSGD